MRSLLRHVIGQLDEVSTQGGPSMSTIGRQGLHALQYVRYQIMGGFIEGTDDVLIFLGFGNGLDGLQILHDSGDLSPGVFENFRVPGRFLQEYGSTLR